MRRARWIILLIGLCGGAGPATQPEPPATRQQLRARIDADAAEVQSKISNWPSIGERKLPDVLLLDYNGRALTPRTLFTPMPRPRALTVEGYPGPWSAWLRFNRAGSPIFFQLERMDVSDPLIPYQHADLSATPGRVMMSYTRETVESTAIVQLLDDRTAPDPNGPRPDGEVRLYVQVSETASERSLVDATIIESDLPTMIANHRELIDIYVRPLLRELGQERLLNPDPAIARQVLSMEEGVDPGVAKEVDRLVPELDSDDFAKRSAASASLKKLGLAGAQLIGKLDRTKLTPEQHKQIDEILETNRPLSAPEADRLASDRAFLVDCLDLNTEAVTARTIKRLESLTGQALVFDAKASGAARGKAVDALRAKLLPPIERPQWDAAATKPSR